MPVFLYNKSVKIEFNKTNKYKYCNAFYFFTLPYSKKTNAALKLLSNVIGESSTLYDTKEKMSKIKDMLYGTSVICEASNNGDYVTLRLNYSFLNPKFTGVDEIEYLNFFKEIIYNCLISKELFEENKRLLIDNIKRTLEKPNVLAKNKVVEVIAKDDPSIMSHNVDIVCDVESLTLKDVKDSYDDLIKNSDVVSVIYGDLKEDIIKGFKEIKLGGDKEYHQIEKKGSYIKKEKVVEEMPFSQSSLFILFTNPITCFSDNSDDWVIGDLLLGGVPTSLLFEEVREKLSLCYDISVSEFVCHGISYIKTNIDGSKADIVIDECNKQINRLINKDYDQSKLESTKEIIINSLIQSKDDFETCAKRYYNQYLSNRYRTTEERIEKIQAITMDDISNLFKEYKPYFIYLLKGTKNE